MQCNAADHGIDNRISCYQQVFTVIRLIRQQLLGKVDTVKEFIREHPGKIELVRFVLFSADVLAEYEKAIEGNSYNS